MAARTSWNPRSERAPDYLDDDLFRQLFTSLVRPILEYGHSVYQPQLKTLCADLEDVQRRATKLVPSLKDLPYPERLKRLRLPSLEHRRNRGDMIDMYKYIHGHYLTDKPHFDLADRTETRGHSLKVTKKRCRLHVRSNYFSHRVVNLWNSLPENTVTAPNLNCFKSRLDAHWRNLTNPTCLQPN